jgi:Ca2+/Na+ antiporter
MIVFSFVSILTSQFFNGPLFFCLFALFLWTLYYISRELVEQEVFTLPKHLSSPPVISGVRVTRSLVLYVRFVDRCLYCYTFSFGHCVFCSSSIYIFWLPLWYLQTLLTRLLIITFGVLCPLTNYHLKVLCNTILTLFVFFLICVSLLQYLSITDMIVLN